LLGNQWREPGVLWRHHDDLGCRSGGCRGRRLIFLPPPPSKLSKLLNSKQTKQKLQIARQLLPIIPCTLVCCAQQIRGDPTLKGNIFSSVGRVPIIKLPYAHPPKGVATTKMRLIERTAWAVLAIGGGTLVLQLLQLLF
jgi:hypothetical protein